MFIWLILLIVVCMIIFQTDGVKKNFWRLDKFSGLAPDLYKRAKDGDLDALRDLALYVTEDLKDEYVEAFKETMNEIN